jgi:hypothetical protein
MINVWFVDVSRGKWIVGQKSFRDILYRDEI